MNTRALVVGIADYEHIRPLPQAVLNDAQAVHALITDSAVGLFPTARLLSQNDATREGLRQAFADLKRECTKDTQSLIYISSHGGSISSGDRAGAYLLPIDTVAETPDALADSAIASGEITTLLRELPAARVLLILDCCHAGALGAPKGLSADGGFFKDGLTAAQVSAMSEGRDRVIMAAARGNEYSWVLASDPNSLFTKHLLAGLRGAAPARDDAITVFDLFDYVQRRTVEEARQHPVFRGEVETNFVVGRAPQRKAPVEPFVYDAFVSYAQTDEGFVYDTLVPYLEKTGLKVTTVDTDSAGVGGFRVATIAEGIKRSRRTIAVISPDYVADQYARFETAFTIDRSVQQASARLIPLIARTTPQLPDLLAPLVAVDYTHARFGKEQALARLAAAVKGPVPTL